MTFGPKKAPTGMTGHGPRPLVIKAPTPMKRTRLRKKSKSDVAVAKDEVQYWVREVVIVRDGGCIFRALPHYLYGQPPCGGYRKDGEMILQADHLVTRSNSATYDDTRLVVCVCKGHHGWKSAGGNLRKKQYDEIVRKLISPARVALWDRAEQDSWRPVHHVASDWRLSVAALKQELAQLK